MAKILRIDMGNQTVQWQDVEQKYHQLGGRGLTSRIVSDEVDPQCHPLGPNNKIVIAPGLVSGTSAASSGRISVGGKSPLTGGIKESNAGTNWAQIAGRLRIKAIIIEGMPQDDTWWGIHISNEDVTFFNADEYAGKGLYDAYPKLFEKYGSKTALMGIGISGEQKMSMAGICFSDKENRPSRFAARGGLGAVLGSKHLKFIVVDGQGAPGVEIADEALFKQGRKKLTDALMNHDVTKPGGGLNSYGTAVLVNILNEVGGLPTRNFREGRFKGAGKISGEAMSELCKKRGGVGKMGHGCHNGCVIQCSNVIPDKDGNELVSVIEYETTWALGANCGIDDLDAIGTMTRMCNDMGIDTIEAGGMLGVAMEAGLIEFGDSKGAIKLLEEIGKNTPLGKILGNGTEATAKMYGVVRCPTVKGQSLPAYEPRVIKGIGMTYAVNPMGGDHTAGYTIASEILGAGGKTDPFDRDKAELVRNFIYTTAFIDTSGHCLFIAFAILDIPTGFEGFVEECNGLLGTQWTADDVGRIGKEVIDREIAFNRAAGLGVADDRLPEFMKYEKVAPHEGLWDITDETLDSVLA
ncbi:MAG: aldehyde ferredoxin oxidoreductase [Phycisphaerae bacterium]|nr:aldehyde ferredoxin oxidoreductase [Phycisphaerae bacterium]